MKLNSNVLGFERLSQQQVNTIKRIASLSRSIVAMERMILDSTREDEQAALANAINHANQEKDHLRLTLGAR